MSKPLDQIAVQVFLDLWKVAICHDERLELLCWAFPEANGGNRRYIFERYDLMGWDIPPRSRNKNAQLTFCDCTLRVRRCSFKFCTQALGPDDLTTKDGLWICDDCDICCVEELGAPPV